MMLPFRSISAKFNICSVQLGFISLWSILISINAFNVPILNRPYGKCKPHPLTQPLELGEGPHWDASRQLLYFVDMTAHEVHSYDPKTGQHRKAKVEGDKDVTLVLPIEGKPNEFLIGHGGNLDIVTWDGINETVSDIRTYAVLETDPSVRLNDGKTSPSGQVFAGSMAKKLPDLTVPRGKANLFVIDRRNGSGVEPRKLIKNADLSNGLCWNKKETAFWWVDTTRRNIYRYDYDRANLEISNERILLNYGAKNLKGNPDGMTIDRRETLFIASVDGGGQVIMADSKTGNILSRIEFPHVSDVSSVAFGGKHLTDLYITTIRKEGEPLSGSLFVCKCLGTRGYAGVPAKIYS